jgi:hypothetical protein
MVEAEEASIDGVMFMIYIAASASTTAHSHFIVLQVE